MSIPVTELLVIVLLTLLEGFFVAAEIALVSIRRSRLDQLVEEGNEGARRVRRLIEEPGRFLAVIQLGLTFLGFFASAYAAVSLVEGLKGLLERVQVLHDSAQGIALVIVTAILALFTIVFGELVPKTLALARPERFALVLSGPVDLLARVLGPIVALLTAITRQIARLFGAEVRPEAQISAEELMIHAVIELGEHRLHEVMVPRIAIVALDASASLDEAIDLVVDEGHSRIPVFEESIDQVIGILYAKDLLPILKNGSGERPSLRTLLRPPVFVPESMTIDDLLHEFQRRKVHIAIVLDEYGGTAGLVTIEDLLEEIVV